MDLDFADTGPAAGRYVLPLTARWAVVAIAPWPGALALALFLDGQAVEVVDDPTDVARYLARLPARWVGGPLPQQRGRSARRFRWPQREGR